MSETHLELHTATQEYIHMDFTDADGSTENKSIHDLNDLKVAYDLYAKRKERDPDQPRMVTAICMPGDYKIKRE